MPLAAGLALAAMFACAPPPQPSDTEADATVKKTSATDRAARRAYDGAPPVIPHDDFGMDCISCHNERGVALEDVGFAPPSPHRPAPDGVGLFARCRQCHVFARTEATWVSTRFAGLRQDLRAGRRLHPFAPPTIPHRTFMRENCTACHTGPAAREEIRTSHPERTRCRQCHVPVVTADVFSGPAVPPPSRR